MQLLGQLCSSCRLLVAMRRRQLTTRQATAGVPACLRACLWSVRASEQGPAVHSLAASLLAAPTSSAHAQQATQAMSAAVQG
jgi:hypothetical protein